MYIPYGKQCIEEDDIEAVVEVLRSDYVTTGPAVAEFEKAVAEYTGAKYAVAVSNGTAALHVACLAAGIKEGDEVITTPITFAASANCAAAGNFNLFAYVYLPQFNAHMERGGQIFYKLSEIHPAFGSEKERDLASVKGKFAVDKLHIQTAFGNLGLCGL